MHKCDCKDCICLRCGSNNDEWFCDEEGCNITEVEVCPEKINGEGEIEDE